MSTVARCSIIATDISIDGTRNRSKPCAWGKELVLDHLHLETVTDILQQGLVQQHGIRVDDISPDKLRTRTYQRLSVSLALHVPCCRLYHHPLVFCDSFPDATGP